MFKPVQYRTVPYIAGAVNPDWYAAAKERTQGPASTRTRSPDYDKRLTKKITHKMDVGL